MQTNYIQFYKQNGVRRLQNLLNPLLFSLNDLPRDSVLHYISYDENEVDVDPSLVYFKNLSKKVVVDYPIEFKHDVGKFMKRNLAIQNEVRSFHSNHKEFRFVKDAYVVVTDPTILLVENYSYVNKAYKYPNTQFAEYYKWINFQLLLWDNINEICKKSSRNNFIVIKLDDVLPNFSQFNLFSAKENNNILDVFNTPDKMFLLELWKWISLVHRERSAMRNLDKAFYNKINIVFTNKKGLSSVMNLGYLFSWIKDDDETYNDKVTRLSPKNIQKMFMSYLVRTHEVTEESEIVNNLTEEETETEQDSFDENIQDTEVLDTVMKTVEKTIVDYDKFNVKKEKAVEEQKQIQQQVLSQQEVSELIFKEKPISEKLKEGLDKQLSQGRLNSVEYKKIIANIESYSVLPDPFTGNNTIDEAMVVSPQDLLIEEEDTKIVASENVLDKGMLESSLIGFDKNYIDKLHNKFLLNVISDIQKAGITIKQHTVEEETDVLGSSEIHTLEIKPIDGMSSKIKFKLPKIQEDGTFKTNNNKIVMRKQKVDYPIRKIEPNKVALTSYYGKTFVSTGVRKADSPLAYIIKQIDKSTIVEGSIISKVVPGNMYDNYNDKVPAIYSMLSSVYRSFRAGRFSLLFDYQKRFTLGDESQIKQWESQGYTVVGVSDDKELLLLSDKGYFHYETKGELETIGNIFSLLQIDELASPVEFSEIKIFNKSVPVGVLLSYYLGLDNLLAYLNVKYRTTDSSRAGKLEIHEYAVSFKNKTFIFDRRHKLASMIIGGWIDYDKQIKQYDYELFNNKDVYYNIFITKGLANIYIKEMDLINDLFVDSITKIILLEIKEPVTFQGLLIRASELLLTYHYPDAQDLNYVRIRGYERLPGIVYNQLVGSIRQYRMKNASGKHKVDISPYQVWQTVLKDNSMKLVEDRNPIQNLKETEAVTYVGEGGRSKDAINKATRAYHVTEVGVISEATVDSKDVAVNAFMSANPNFQNLLGMVKKDKKVNPTSMVSTSALCGFSVHNDDAKRVKENIILLLI